MPLVRIICLNRKLVNAPSYLGTQGLTVNGGGSTKLTFIVSRGEPGDYGVYVDGVPAGSFKVELFRESDRVLIFSAIMLAVAFVVGMIMLRRRQRAV